MLSNRSQRCSERDTSYRNVVLLAVLAPLTTWSGVRYLPVPLDGWAA